MELRGIVTINNFKQNSWLGFEKAKNENVSQRASQNGSKSEGHLNYGEQ